MQRRFLLIVALFLLLGTACGGDEGENGAEDVPTAVPTLADEVESSPRVTQTPSANVPPTWTPSSPLAEPTLLTPPADVPEGAAPPSGGAEPDANDEVYVVQAGDTLAEIAIAFGVDLGVLAEVNDIENIDVIEVGQQLVIPRD